MIQIARFVGLHFWTSKGKVVHRITVYFTKFVAFTINEILSGK